MHRILTLGLALVVVACGPSAAQPVSKASPTAAPTPSAQQLVPLPPPSLHPNYPPANLADLVALARRGVPRRFIGAEGQALSTCSRAWNKVYEPDGTPPDQIAADLMKVAIDRHAALTSCGGFIYGTTNRAYCNCYTGDHGLLVINRGPDVEPAPGKMLVTFSLNDSQVSPEDWEVIVDTPTA